MHMKELVEAGYVGEVLAVHVSLLREGVLSRPSHRTWQRDAELGANTLTIANGHTVDAMRFVAGDFARLSAVVTTQAKQWLDTGTNTWLDVTSPDNVLVSGRLANGAVASVHIGAIPFAGSGYRMEIYGREGTLVATGEDSPQLSEVFLHGAQRGNKLQPMPVPERFTFAAPGTPSGEAAQCRPDVRAVRPGRSDGGDSRLPDFRDRGRPAPPGRCHQAGVGQPGGRSISTEPTRSFAATRPQPSPASGEGSSNADGGGRIELPIQFGRRACKSPSPACGEGRVGVFGAQFRKAESAAPPGSPPTPDPASSASRSA